MNAESLKEAIKRELPGWLREDPDLRAYILELTRQEYAGRAETQDRFYEILAELRRNRDEQNRKWDEQNQQWKDFTQEQNRKWDEQNRKWDEQNRLWHEQWEAHQRQHKEEFDRVHEEIMALAKKHER